MPCIQSSVEVCAKSRWPPWAFRPNELYGFCGRKATLNYALGIGHSLSLICQPADIRGHEALHHVIIICLVYIPESRRDQEEGDELDSHEEAISQKGSRAGRWCWARDRELDFFCLSHLFPSGGATDIVTQFCIAVGTAIAWCRGCCSCAMPDGHCL